jgi:hypothetical protein
MRHAGNKEVRQARCFLYKRGMHVTTHFCRIFANAARLLGVTFADLDVIMRERSEETI